MTERRRDSDPRIDELLDHQRTHLKDFHAKLRPGEAATLIEEHKTMLTDISTLKHDSALTVELIAGKIILDPFTHQPTGERETGIADRVESLEYNSNGGRGLSIRMRDKVETGLWGGLIAGGAIIVAAWIGS